MTRRTSTVTCSGRGGRGYKAGASREITEEEIAAAMAETRKFITLPGAWMENIIRIAFDAARRKAMEE